MIKKQNKTELTAYPGQKECHLPKFGRNGLETGKLRPEFLRSRCCHLKSLNDFGQGAPYFCSARGPANVVANPNYVPMWLKCYKITDERFITFFWEGKGDRDGQPGESELNLQSEQKFIRQRKGVTGWRAQHGGGDTKVTC